MADRQKVGAKRSRHGSADEGARTCGLRDEAKTGQKRPDDRVTRELVELVDREKAGRTAEAKEKLPRSEALRGKAVDALGALLQPVLPGVHQGRPRTALRAGRLAALAGRERETRPEIGAEELAREALRPDRPTPDRPTLDLPTLDLPRIGQPKAAPRHVEVPKVEVPKTEIERAEESREGALGKGPVSGGKSRAGIPDPDARQKDRTVAERPLTGAKQDARQKRTQGKGTREPVLRPAKDAVTTARKRPPASAAF